MLVYTGVVVVVATRLATRGTAITWVYMLTLYIACALSTILHR